MDDERGLRIGGLRRRRLHLPGSRVVCFPPKLHIGRFSRRRPRTPKLLSTVLRHVYAESPPYGQVNWFVWGHPRVLSLGVEPVLAPPPPSKGARSGLGGDGLPGRRRRALRELANAPGRCQSAPCLVGMMVKCGTRVLAIFEKNLELVRLKGGKKANLRVK